MKKVLEVVLPVFNEEENIPILVQLLDQVAEELGSEFLVHYLFINDGSTDRTGVILQELVERRKEIRTIELLHNFGHGAALACGIDYCQGDLIVFMDADLQDLPEYIPVMVEKWKIGAKTIVASREKRREWNAWLFSIFYFFLHKLAKNLPQINFGTFCLLDRSVVERLRFISEKNRYFPGLVSYVSEEIVSIPIERAKRFKGNSRVGIFGLIHLALVAYSSFSTVPVRFVSSFGILASFLGFFGGLGIIATKLWTNLAIPGWASIMASVAFGSGVQLFCLGIIGEYVARIYEETKSRPLYLVRQSYRKEMTKIEKTSTPTLATTCRRSSVW